MNVQYLHCNFCAKKKSCTPVSGLELKNEKFCAKFNDLMETFRSELITPNKLSNAVICKLCWLHIRNAYMFVQKVLKAQQDRSRRKVNKNNRKSDIKADIYFQSMPQESVISKKQHVKKERLILPKPVIDDSGSMTMTGTTTELSDNSSIAPISRAVVTITTQTGLQINSLDNNTTQTDNKNRRIYKCYNCIETFISFRKLRAHTINKHFEKYNNNLNICEYCCCLLPMHIELSEHVSERHAGESKYCCLQCPKVKYKSIGFLSKHVSKAHQKNGLIYYCTLCNSDGQCIEFETRPDLQEHFMDCHDIDDCIMDEEFLEEYLPHNGDDDNSLQLAENWEALDLMLPDMFGLEEQVIEAAVNSSNSNGSNMDATAFECPKCETICTNLKILLIHLSEQHDLDLLICDRCNMAFQKQTHFDTHKIVCDINCVISGNNNNGDNSNSNTFQCKICDKILKTKFGLNYHVNTHNNNIGRLPGSTTITKTKTRVQNKHDGHECPYCSKLFRQGYNLKQHIRTMHSKVRRHICQLCDRQFATLDHLKKHVLSQHQNDRKYICSLCTKSFTQLCHLKQHLTTHGRTIPMQHQ